MNQKTILGKTGENIVYRHLNNKGYKIIGRNIRLKNLEIDIVYVDHETLVICEVRTVSCITFGKSRGDWQVGVNHETQHTARNRSAHIRDAADFVSRRKKLNLLRAASMQRFMINNLNAPVGSNNELGQRIDLFCVEVLANYKRHSIRHFRGI